MSALHQFVPTLEPGGVGGHVMELQRLAREELGVDSEVFAQRVAPAMEGRGRPCSDYGRRVPARSDDVLVYHMALGSAVADFVAARSERLVVNHHNVTPPSFNDPWEPEAAYECAWGRAQLQRLAGRAVLGVAASRYSEDELRRAGYRATATVPVLVDLTGIVASASRAEVERLSADKEGGGSDWLFVGRLATNKCQHDLVAALAAYRRLYDPRARLHLVGGTSSAAYRHAVERYAAALGVGDAVRVTGAVGRGQLVAHYLTADVFVSASEHEGFAIPLLEALACRLPVVAHASTAVPGTLGDAGVLLPTKEAAVMAAAVHRVVTDEVLRRALVRAGEARARELDLGRTRARWLETLAAYGLTGTTPGRPTADDRAAPPPPTTRPSAPEVAAGGARGGHATVTFRPAGLGASFALTGQAGDDGVVAGIERSGGTYEPALLAALRARLRPDSVSFDVGANIGAVTLVMSELSPRGRVFAFEPSPANFAHLVGNLAANHASNVVAEQLALYDENATLPFTVSDAYPAGSHVPAAEGGRPTTTVEAVRLDDYVERQRLSRLDLVKLDVEGAEMNVLRGARRTMARLAPDLVVEVNPVALRRFHRASFRELVALVRSTHRRVFSLDEDGRAVAVLSDDHLARLLGRHGVVNLLAVAAPPAAALRPWGDLGAHVRGAGALARLHARSNRWRRPATDFVVEPDLRVEVVDREVRGAPGQRVSVQVRMANRSRHWLSSESPYHPVHASYRWYDEDGEVVDEDGRRTMLHPPVPPGGTAALALEVDLPPGPGRYQLGVTLVQEAFAWLDQLDPALCRRVPATVE